MAIKRWTGNWFSPCGYWVKINYKNETVVFSRSGDLKSSLGFKSLSEDGKQLVYEERGVEVGHFQHTLTLINDHTLEAEVLDLKAQQFWQNFVMHKNSIEDKHKPIDQGPALTCEFNEEVHDILICDFVDRMMAETRDAIKESFEDLSLNAHELSDIKLNNLTEKVCFALASVLDGCDVMGDEKAAMPHLTFRANGKLISNRLGTTLHERVHAYFED